MFEKAKSSQLSNKLQIKGNFNKMFILNIAEKMEWLDKMSKTMTLRVM